MSALDFYTLDVFTDQPFAGNPLAVFPDAGKLPDERMTQLTRELNLSETVFVTGSGPGNRFDVRIFTPGGEIPFAGHPTVGTALLLKRLGRLQPGAESSLTLVQRVGDVPVTFRGEGGDEVARFRTALAPEVGDSELDPETAAAMLGLEPGQLVRPPRIASCGTPFQMFEVTDIESLGRAQLDLALWRRALAGAAAPDLYLYTRSGESLSVRARMFGPGFNIAEDPATGAAASALAGMLALDAATPGLYRLRIEQGVEMGRPSLILTEVRVGDAGVESVEVEGQARLLSQGRFLLP
ncbi:MAG: PhzF family phenazine biosynthesis protein [Oceanospirillaceae bacterium]|nr:PhzF family phenazine biosynthesis protein [Oceanospirillaceae bacterium]